MYKYIIVQIILIIFISCKKEKIKFTDSYGSHISEYYSEVYMNINGKKFTFPIYKGKSGGIDIESLKEIMDDKDQSPIGHILIPESITNLKTQLIQLVKFFQEKKIIHNTFIPNELVYDRDMGIARFKTTFEFDSTLCLEIYFASVKVDENVKDIRKIIISDNNKFPLLVYSLCSLESEIKK